jgi:3-oxoacyl-[acyl-carrier protein] reductase
LFSQAGARVVSVDLRGPAEPFASVRHVEADVSNFEAVERCVDEIVASEGGIDCLVNNAGISRDAVLWKMGEEDWDQVLAVNLKGAFNFVRHVAPHMKRSERGKIVNVSSINGLRGKRGLVNYASAKAGLIGLTKTVARELGRYNVNVNAVAPGLVRTDLTNALPQRFIEQALGESVLGRLAEPEDVAQVVLFLCSEQARQITGEVIKIDGGQYI